MSNPNIHFIPGPDNDLVPEEQRDDTIRFPIHADVADTASFLEGYIASASYAKYAETSSFTLGYILSASYANFASTASYLLGSVTNAISCSWAAMAGHALTAETASYALQAGTSSYGLIAISSSKAITASYSNVSVSSSYSSYSLSSSYSITSSYAITSSYSSNSISSSYSILSDTSSYLNGTASYSQYAATASYVSLTQLALSSDGNGLGYINVFRVDNISVATIIDSFSTGQGLSAKWLLSINDGTNFKTSEVLAIWNPANNSTNFAEVTTNSLGTIPVAMSVSLSGGLVRLIANPSSGNWTIKLMRFLI
jgi:hypothetical protein